MRVECKSQLKTNITYGTLKEINLEDGERKTGLILLYLKTYKKEIKNLT